MVTRSINMNAKGWKIKWGVRRLGGERGQSLLESALVLVMASFIFFGLFQVVLVVQGYQVQQWATFAAGRSRIVGFNDTVVHKAWLIGNILNSGTMMAPSPGLNSVQQVGVELDAIPLFLQSIEPAATLAPQLNYEHWRRLPMLPAATAFDQYASNGEQNFPLMMAGMIPMLQASMGRTNLQMETQSVFENHFPLYLDVD